MNEKRLIDANVALKELDTLKYDLEQYISRLDADVPYDVYERLISLVSIEDIKLFKELIENIPTVEERPKGEWIDGYVDSAKTPICSNCGSGKATEDRLGFLPEDDNRYCHWCGAYMRGDN